MNRAELDAFLAERGFKVDDIRNPHASERNRFRDLYIGVGKSPEALTRLKKELKEKMPHADIRLVPTSNLDHPDYGKPMLEINGYWDE